MQESLFEWRDVLLEFITFVASFLATGAVGFRFAVLRGRTNATSSEDFSFYVSAARRAAMLGLVGAITTGVLLATRLPGAAARAHTDVMGLLSTNMMTLSQVVLLGVGILGFLLAVGGIKAGWMLAFVGIIASPLRGVFTGQFLRLVNPLHLMFGGLWIGTLMVLLVAGIGTLLASESARTRKGRIAADMVNSFSPFALFASVGVATFGVTTAWRHLKVLSNLWSTPYGYVLISKLCAVAIVVAFGAWNWKRQRPKLGSVDGLHTINRSARAEVIAATLVMFIAAILVSIPAPKAPGSKPEGPAGKSPPVTGVPAGIQPGTAGTGN